MHLKCRWRAATYANILDVARVAEDSPGCELAHWQTPTRETRET